MRIITVIQFNYTNITVNAMQQQCYQSEIQHAMHSSFKSSNQRIYIYNIITAQLLNSTR